jgi:hypothetical protein
LPSYTNVPCKNTNIYSDLFLHGGWDDLRGWI